MSLSNAKDWIRTNIPTETRGSTEYAVASNDGVTEYIPVAELAELYQTTMEDATKIDLSIPNKDPVNVRDSAVQEAKNRGTGHERFFNQA